jgi:hypothetical protein
MGALFFEQVTSVKDIDSHASIEFSLSQNYPNPFNPDTQIEYSVPQTSHIIIRIYNLFGQEIKTLVDEQQSKGNYRVTWNGRTEDQRLLPSGIYLLKMVAANYQKTIRLVFVR